jgi:hypothetical protein
MTDSYAYFPGPDGPMKVKLADTGAVAADGSPIYALYTGTTVDIGAQVLTSPDPATYVGDVVLNAGSALVGKVGIDQTTPGTTNGVEINAALPAGANTIGAVLDGGPAWTTTRQYTTSADMSAAPADLTAAPGGGLKQVITDLLVVTDTDMVLTLTEETAGTVQMAIGLKAGVQFQFTPRGKWKLATAVKKLQGRTSVSGNIYITVMGYTEA